MKASAIAVACVLSSLGTPAFADASDVIVGRWDTAHRNGIVEM